MIDFDGIVRTELSLFLLECGRISGIIMIAPLAWANAPVRVKAVLVLLLGFVAHGLSVKAAVPESTLLVATAMVVELGIGIVVGLIVRFIVAIAEIAGEIIGPAIGLSMASAFDPTTQSNQSQLGAILRYLMIFIALLIGVHRVLLGGLLASFRLLPVGTAESIAVALPGLVQLSVAVISAGVRIALPLVAVLYMTQIALAFIARAAPQMQVFNVGFAVMLAVGLSVFALMLPDFARAFVIELSQVAKRIEDMLFVFGARP